MTDQQNRHREERVRQTINTKAREVSLDYLIGYTDTLLDRNVVKKILDIQKLKPNDKDHVLALIGAFLKQTKIQSIM